jgi:hypothetical protein
MSFNTTIDNLVYEATTQPENVAEKVFVQKEWNNPVYDTNTSAEYSTNQIQFDTTTLMNCGSLVSYREGVILLPLVIKITSNNAANNWTNTAGLVNTDFMISLKNSHTNLVQSIAVNMNNQDILQPVPLSNAYLTFIQHSELSFEDELLNAPLHGYCKDSSQSWSYEAISATANGRMTGTAKGVGISNNSNASIYPSLNSNEAYNEGLVRRQQLINKFTNQKKTDILGTVDRNKQEAKSYIENQDGGKYIYYVATLRLQDIQPHFFPNFPLTQGVKFKITLTLNNNVTFKFQKNAAGRLIFNNDSFGNVTSPTNPLMIAASYDDSQVVSNGVAITEITTTSALQPCGTATLKCNDADEYTVSMRLGKNTNSGALTQCILYCPTYRMNPKYEVQYFQQNRIRKIHYTELEYQSFTAKPVGSFNVELSSTCVRPKRLIMVGFLDSDANGGINPLSSPFASEPATTSPFVLTQFNCSISSNNVYPNDITYSYDNFLQNLNGQTGINSNLVNGLVSSRINLIDFQNNYHYIVVDLSRRLPEFDMVSNSIRVRGALQSPKNIVFHCYIEKERIIEVDIMTGALISRS